MPKSELVLVSRDELEHLRKGVSQSKLLESLELARREGYESGYKMGLEASRASNYEEGYAKGLACGVERGKSEVVHKIREESYKSGMEQGRADILESFQSELDVLSRMHANIEGKTYAEGFQHGVARGIVGLKRVRLKHLQLQQLADRTGHCEREKRRYYNHREEIHEKKRLKAATVAAASGGAGGAVAAAGEASSSSEE